MISVIGIVEVHVSIASVLSSAEDVQKRKETVIIGRGT